MKIIFSILVLVHGIIHLLGFLKGTGLKDIKELRLEYSNTSAYVWLIASGLFVLFGISYLFSFRYSWIIGFLSVLISTFLIIIFWQDTKFGIIPNVIVLLVVIVNFGSYFFENQFEKEKIIILQANDEVKYEILDKEKVKNLPKIVQIWINNSGILNRDIINVGKIIQKAKLKMKPEQEDWYEASAIQYSTVKVPAFVWFVDVKMNDLLFVYGRDKYENGKGSMIIKINSLIKVVDEKGAKLDEGTLQRYLGEMVWLPNVALSPYVVWKEINDTVAEATMSYNGVSGTGRFYFNKNGDVVKYQALRYMGNNPDAKKFNWVMTITDYKVFEGVKIPSKMFATWEMENKNWTWIQLEVVDIKYNISS